MQDNLKQRNIYIKYKKRNVTILLITITKAKYNNWLNENKKEQASKFSLLLKLRRISCGLSPTQAPQSPTSQTIQVIQDNIIIFLIEEINAKIKDT